MTTADGGGVPDDQTHLAAMAPMRARYGVPVGFIDHTSSVAVPAIAAARGADVVTKHFTWARSARGPDWQVCLEPEELAEAIRLVRLADRTAGSSAKALVAGEQADRSAMRRSIVAAADLPAGTELGRKHLAFKRPGTGLSPKRVDEVLGRRLEAALKADEPLSLDHLA
jgi:sialic acid synthase SpsE